MQPLVKLYLTVCLLNFKLFKKSLIVIICIMTLLINALGFYALTLLPLISLFNRKLFSFTNCLLFDFAIFSKAIK